MRIISRAEWGAREPTSITHVDWDRRSGFMVHHSGGSRSATPRSLQDYAMDQLGYRDTHYNFFVKDGLVYEGRGATVLAAHASGYNTSDVGVCVIGRDADVTLADMAAVRWLYGQINQQAGRTLAMHWHSLVDETRCPGDRLREWMRAGMPAAGLPSLPQEDAMGYGTITKDAKGDAATWVQNQLRFADPASLPEFGVDGHWGDETAEWVARLFGGDGTTWGPAQYERLRELEQERAAELAADRVLAQLPEGLRLPLRVSLVGELAPAADAASG